MTEQEYLEQRLNDQIEWYGKKSQWNKKMYKTMRIIEIVIAALIPVVMPFSDNYPLVKMFLALGGSIVAITIAIQGLYNFHENWIEYRMVAETLKHEKYLYETKSGIYNSTEDSFKLLVDRVESIISHENINWSQINKCVDKK